MRVLILSVTAGQGHNTCGKAIMAALEARGIECRMLDTLKQVSAMVGNSVDKGYLLMGKFTPAAFGKMYETALHSSIKQNSRLSVSDLIGPALANKLAQYIDIYQPDAIVCTHIFASLIMTYLREKKMLNVLTIGVNTDFSIHPFWEQADQDHIVLACDKMNYSAYIRGLDAAKILPYGIPVDQKFNVRMTAQQAREKLALPEKLTLSVMSGSMGFGHLLDHIRQLDTLPLDFQIVSICGSNKDAYSHIEQQRATFAHAVHNFGYVNNMPEFLCASDIVITKPGGLSTSECMTVERPMVLVDPIPGLEQFNAEFLVNYGAAVYVGKHYPLAEAVYNLLTSPDRILSMMQAQRAINPGRAAERLVDFLVSENTKPLGEYCQPKLV